MKNLLNQLRKDKGFTQEFVANYLGTGRTYYNRMENGNINEISLDYLSKLSQLYEVSLDYLLNKGGKVRIPVLGSIPAGIPIEAVEDIIDYEEIPYSIASTGEFFGLKVKGDSMNPRIESGDVVIIRKQEDAENGDVCVIMINGSDATLKQIHKSNNSLTLIPFNPNYTPVTYTNEQILQMPVSIIGKVIELRAKF